MKIVNVISKFEAIKFNNFHEIGRTLDLIRKSEQYHEMINSEIQLLMYVLKCDFDVLLHDAEIKNYFDTISFKNLEDREKIISIVLKKHIDFSVEVNSIET